MEGFLEGRRICHSECPHAGRKSEHRAGSALVLAGAGGAGTGSKDATGSMLLCQSLAVVREQKSCLLHGCDAFAGI